MTKNEAKQKITELFSAQTIYDVIEESVMGIEFDLESPENCKATFFNLFSNQIEELADLVSSKDKSAEEQLAIYDKATKYANQRMDDMPDIYIRLIS